MEITSKQAQPFAKVAFPDYSGRKFSVEYTRRITLHDLNWDGGSRNQYAAISVNSMEKRLLVAPAPWADPIEGATIDIPAGMMVVCHSFFYGQDCGLTFYVNPMDAPKLIR